MKSYGMILGLLVVFITTLFTNATEPWWHNPQLEWRPFTALPTINGETSSQWSWEIQERIDGENQKFFAHSVSNHHANFLTANASVTPSFVNVSTNLSSLAGATSTAMATWNNSFEEFFVGRGSGVWRFDEAQNMFVQVFNNWTPDTTMIVSLGNSLFGKIPNWGSLSGYYVWKPDGTSTYQSTLPYNSEIWGDPVSGNYGCNSYIARKFSKTQSVILGKYYSPGYSLDGLATPLKLPVGLRADGESLYVSDFYCYTDNIVIVNATYPGDCKLFIGKLGETFHSLAIPVATINTLFYSPSLRLLIAGNAPTNQLFYAVLPAPDEDLIPKMWIESVDLVQTVLEWKWNSQQTPVRVEKSADLAQWETITPTQVIVEGQTRVTIPNTESTMFFRLAYP